MTDWVNGNESRTHHWQWQQESYDDVESKSEWRHGCLIISDWGHWANDGHSPEVGCLAKVLPLPLHPDPGAAHHQDPPIQRVKHGERQGEASLGGRRCRPCVPVGGGGGKVRKMGTIVSRCLKECERPACRKNQRWPLPRGNLGPRTLFLLSHSSTHFPLAFKFPIFGWVIEQIKQAWSSHQQNDIWIYLDLSNSTKITTNTAMAMLSRTNLNSLQFSQNFLFVI